MHAALALYPSLAEVVPSLADLGFAATAQQVAAGTTLFAENTPCRGFPLVLAGEVKVARHAPDGRALELYRVGPGELCLVSCASLFQTQPLSAQGVSTQATRVLMIAPTTFRQWLDTPAFRDAVLGLFAQRMADLSALVDALAFQKLDRRLAAALLGHGHKLNRTHQALADELGTVREMVTRLLRSFEREGWVQLGREQISIQDSAALRALARGDEHPG